uniref:Integrase core domain containing protein n=1 Tax=Solanum tuberosum TaxID=4113 RepID=M1DE44_SOLTU
MEWSPGSYSEEIVREFYASYAATVRNSISKQAKPAAQPPLESTLVRGFPVDISERNADQMESLLRWLARQIATNGERAEWVQIPSLGIKKATLRFATKFFCVAKTLDISLIRDDANVDVSHREPQVELPPLGDDLVADVEQMQVDDTAPPIPTADA